jgi:hypothetical protein
VGSEALIDLRGVCGAALNNRPAFELISHGFVTLPRVLCRAKF